MRYKARQSDNSNLQFHPDSECEWGLRKRLSSLLILCLNPGLKIATNLNAPCKGVFFGWCSTSLCVMDSMEPRRSFCMPSLLSSNILMTSSKGIPLGGLPFDTGYKTTNSTSQVFSLVNDDLVIMISSGVKDSSEFRFSLSDFNLLHETKKILFGSLLREVSPNFHNFCWNLVHFLKIKYPVFFCKWTILKGHSMMNGGKAKPDAVITRFYQAVPCGTSKELEKFSF